MPDRPVAGKPTATFRAAKVAVGLFLIWVCATAVNLTKAVHIDDSAHLQIARWITNNPLHPMSGVVVVRNAASPIRDLHQPHLFFYLMAAVMWAFGESLIALHLLVAAFTLIALVFFHLAAAHAAPRHALFWTALFGLGPVFMPGQNIMTDIPVTALWCVFLWALVREVPGCRHYVFAALAAAVACLTKYTSLILLPVLLLAIIVRRDWRYLWVLVVPLLALLGWSLFNYYDYGGVHLLGRPRAWLPLWLLMERTVLWILGLGAASPFVVAFLSELARRRTTRPLLLAGLAGAALMLIWRLRPEHRLFAHVLLRVGFMANGCLLIAVMANLVAGGVRNNKNDTPPHRSCHLILGVTMLGAFLFVVAFAPFAAIRHILPATPAILLLLAHHTVTIIPHRLWRYAALTATIGLGLILAISDWYYADVYRKHAEIIVARFGKQRTIWFLGSWGWEWYARAAGMQQYVVKHTKPQEGDLLVTAVFVDAPPIPPALVHRLKRVETIPVPSRPCTYVRTAWPCAGYYSYNTECLPWTISQMPIEIFEVFEVQGEPAAPPPCP